MTRLKLCSSETISLIKKMFSFLIKEAFRHKFKSRCPNHLIRVRDMCFLPHLLEVQTCWQDLTLQQISSALEIAPNDFELALTQPAMLIPERGTHPLGAKLLQHRLDNNGALPTRMRMLYSWNLSSWTAVSSSDYRLRRCRRFLRQGPICLQETKWKGHEAEALYQSIPGVKIAQSPAVAFHGRACTGGVAILFPPGWSILDEVALVPGRGVASLVQDRTCKFYVVSVYIHPDNRKRDAEALVRAWRFLDKKTDYVFLAGDFNGLDKHHPEVWDKLLLHFQCSDVHPDLATYRHARGVSCLDRVLVPDSLINTAKLFASASVITSHAANGHDIVKARISVRPNVLNDPRHPKHEVIPSGVFMPGKDGTPVASTAELQSLIRLLQREHTRLFLPWESCKLQHASSEFTSGVTGRCSPQDNDDPAVANSHVPGRCSPYDNDESSATFAHGSCTSSYFAAHMSIVGCFWSWWRTQLPPQLHPHIRPYCRARKYLSSGAQWVNVPKEVVEDLITASRSAILTSTNSLQQVNGCFAMPRALIQSLVEVIDACVEGIPYVPTDEANMQARGLGTMVAFWERMRNICPKVNLYHGPIYGKSGEQCTTSMDLDEAMLATRDFWFQPPDHHDDAWQPVLDEYAKGTSWPSFPPPGDDVFYHTLLHTKDSAPGPDGVPYSAWRLLPQVTVDALKSYFADIVNGTALPPHQVGVWIPKAKMGPEADCFRPLGMPNTLDRLVDGSVAAHAMHQTAHMMHPSQAVMSYFKEPQKAVSCIQRILDGEEPAITLLADLSKAFERVNPYWILELLRIKRAPRWLFAYTKFILFHRRVSHKVQGRLLPGRTILQGVDMGRSFSVYLFCLAMDPLFTYLNRIPGVISVQGYVDDTTIAGDAQDLEWLTQVSACYASLRTAGFVVDSHSCFRACLTIHNRLRPTLSESNDIERHWPELLSSEAYPTALAAMKANYRPGYNTVVARICSASASPDDVTAPGSTCCLVGVFAFQQILDIQNGVQLHHLGAFATVGCKCKSKSNILTNMALRDGAVRRIEDAGFGVQAMCAKAPSLGLALVGRYEFTAEGSLGKVEVSRGLDNYNTGPFRKLLDRLKSFNRPTLSIIARCTGFNTFILSVMPYTISYFGLTSTDLNRLRQAAARFILKRHWLEAEILPYVLRYLGIATLLDPAVSATVAATGLYLREGNPIEELSCHPGRDSCCNVRQRAVVLELFNMWAPFIGIEELIRSISAGNCSVPKRLKSLKNVIITRMVQEAQSRVMHKIYNEGWSGGISPGWIALLTEAPRTWCNGIGRYTLLRWALNQDDDVWLSMRGTRHQQKCGSCGLPGDSFPHGYYHPPMCEACIRAADMNAWSLAPWSHALCTAYIADSSQEQMRDWAQEWEIMPAHDVVCRACGCGDNTVGHWTRWCIVPLVVAIAILKPSHTNLTLAQLACLSTRHAVVCTLVLASFRRLLRQEGAFLHQQAAEPKRVQWWILKLHEDVAQDAHVQLHVEFPVRGNGIGRCILNDTLVGAQRILPLDYSTMHLPPIVGICTDEVSHGTQFAVLALNSPVASALREMEVAGLSMQSNVQVGLTSCQCGAFHVALTATEGLCKGDTLVPTTTCPPRVIVQFDRSLHRVKHAGGAGAVLLQVESNGLSLLDWGARAIPNCADNIVAETYGADLAITLYDKYRVMCQEQDMVPLPLDCIQGDIKPLLHHLDFRGRFRCRDLVTLIHQFHAKRSRIAPGSITEYRPREANALADYFAGQASASLIGADPSDLQLGKPFEVPTDPPYDLLLATNAVILGPHRSGKTVLVLPEQVGCDMYQMALFASWDEGRYAKSVRAIALATRLGQSAISVEYLSATPNDKGRLYARQISAQTLPRDLRLLVYGATHKEVDMSGAHYELIRAMCASKSMPPVRTLRLWLQQSWSSHQQDGGEEEVRRAIKLFPLRVINGGAAQALNSLGILALPPPPWLAAFAYELEAARDTATSHMLAVMRPRLEVDYRNRHFRATETIESIVMQLFLLEVRKRSVAPSIIWLHDGFWIDKQVADDILVAAEKYVRTRLFPQSDSHEPLFRIVDLTEARDAVLLSLPSSPLCPLFPPSKWSGQLPHQGQKRLTRQFPVAKFIHRTGSKRKVSTYFHRVAKRARKFWLRS